MIALALLLIFLAVGGYVVPHQMGARRGLVWTLPVVLQMLAFLFLFLGPDISFGPHGSLPGWLVSGFFVLVVAGVSAAGAIISAGKKL